MRIIVSDFGAFIGKSGNRIIVKDSRGKSEFSLDKIDQILIECHGTCISNDLIRLLANRGIDVFFLSSDAVVATLTYSTPSYSSRIKRAQYENYKSEKAVVISKSLISSKIKNQLWVLKELKRTNQISGISNVKRRAKMLLNQLEAISSYNINNVRNNIFAIEANFSYEYWERISKIVHAPGREKRGATHPFNASLNYAYAILYGNVLSSTIKACLDPYAGFLHTDQPNRCSLVFDLMEPFRPLIDKSVLSRFTLKMFKKTDFDDRKLLLTKSGKKKVVAAVYSLLDSQKNFLHKRRSILSIIRLQCSALAKYLTDEKRFFPCFEVN